MVDNNAAFATTYLNRIGDLVARLVPRRDSDPIDSAARLNAFVATRAAFVAQKTLFGYLKTRIGTRYPKVFDDAVFGDSINIAKMHMFAACVSDLSIYAVARALAGSNARGRDRKAMALDCFDAALAANRAAAGETFDEAGARAEFLIRLDGTDWAGLARQRENFTRSPAALVRWAPIAPELKRFDAEIVENSVKFAWKAIRQDFERRLDAAAFAAAAGEASGGGETGD